MRTGHQRPGDHRLATAGLLIAPVPAIATRMGDMSGENRPADEAGFIPKLYGRRQDKPLKPRQARLMETLLPRLAISLSDGQQTDSDPTKIDLAALFAPRDRAGDHSGGPPARNFQLELGFGGGEHLAWQAERAPDTGFIGAEPFVNGVAKLLSAIDEKGLQNIRILPDDGRPLVEALPDAALERIYVLHPDPWPKRRHFKRRIVSPWLFAQATRLLKPGGELRVASDIPDYIRWTLMHARAASALEWTATRADDWRIRPDDWPQTRYEAKAIRQGRPPAYLIFRRR